MNPINIFIAYARKDTPFLEKLRVYLRPISRSRNIRIWYDGEIVPGTEWEANIKKHLHDADIILLMLSADALNSDFFYDIEMKRALEQHQSGKSIVIPVILSHCLWDEPELQLTELQALPQDGKPIEDWVSKSKAYDNIVRGVRRSIDLVTVKQRKIKPIKEDIYSERIGKEETGEKLVEGFVTLNQKQEKYISNHQNSTRSRYFSIIIISTIVLIFLFVLFSPYFTQISAEEKAAKIQKLIDDIVSAQVEQSTQIQKLIDDMILVQGGTLIIGCLPKKNIDCEQHRATHQVTLMDFKIGRFEVTQAQWEAVTGENPSHFKNCLDCPVENVSWSDVQNFIEQLNQKTGEKFRLPTEEEWEFAARGGNKSRAYKYAGSNDLKEIAWYRKNSRRKTHEVGGKKANELDLYDMSGNVWEWCGTNHRINLKINFKEKSKNIFGVLRGGAWLNYNSSCSALSRSKVQPTIRYPINGFRLAQ